MNRNDVVDVLSVVASASRRSIGETDVDVWQAVIGGLPKDYALQAVRDHLRDEPGVWIEPGHIYQRARALRRDELDREPDEVRGARQEALAAKAAEDVAELAQRKSIPVEPEKFMRPVSNHLRVSCPWCHASVGQRCVVPGTNVELTRQHAHPARLELLA